MAKKGYKNGWKYQNTITEQQKKYVEHSKEWEDLEQQRWKKLDKSAGKAGKTIKDHIVEPINKLVGKIAEIGDKFLDLFVNKMQKNLEDINVTTEETL
jgi:hypothetical protein